jgi:hypothetical protein
MTRHGTPTVPWIEFWKKLLYFAVVTDTYYLLGYSREIGTNVLGLEKLIVVK